MKRPRRVALTVALANHPMAWAGPPAPAHAASQIWQTNAGWVAVVDAVSKRVVAHLAAGEEPKRNLVIDPAHYPHGRE